MNKTILTFLVFAITASLSINNVYSADISQKLSESSATCSEYDDVSRNTNHYIKNIFSTMIDIIEFDFVPDGFKIIDGKRYYFNPDGSVCTGMTQIDCYTYYFREDGSAVTGWLNLNGKKYYFNAGGIMKKGILNIDNDIYIFGDDGSMQKGLIRYNDNLYFLFDNGKAHIGWRTIGSSKYYFGKNGTAKKGIAEINGKKYFFNPESGALCRNISYNGITTNNNGRVTKVLLDTEYISQIGYPTGCESVSAVMLLRDAGYDTTIDIFIDDALEIGWHTWVGDVRYGPHPNESFIGDPRKTSGYGCYAPVITRALNTILDGDCAVDLTGTPISELLTKYVDKGTPVAIWATINMMKSTPGSQWIIRSTGEDFTWKRNEHCLVLVGYDDEYYYLNDPYNGNGLVPYKRDVVEARFEYMGSQSVVILQDTEITEQDAA